MRRFIIGLLAIFALLAAGATPAQAAAPGTPQNFDSYNTTTVGAADPMLTLTWTAPANDGGSTITAYRIYKDGQLLSTTDAVTLLCDIAGLTKGQQYTFAVSAVNADGEGPQTSLTTIAQTPPSAPLNVTAVPGDGEVTLSWDPPWDDGGTGITGYEVESSPGAKDCTTQTGPTSCVVGGLTNGTEYEFTVRAKNQAWPILQGTESEPVMATPAATPSGPQRFRATATGSTTVELAWQEPASDGGSPITSYQVEFSEGGVTTFWTAYASAAPTARSMTVAGLTSGIEYHFRIAAVNAIGPGSYTMNVIKTPLGPPAAPTEVFIAAEGNRAAKVEWEEPSPDGGAAPSSYRITATPLPAVLGLPDVVVTCATKTPSEECTSDYVVTGLANGVTYAITVAATNKMGTGPESGPPAYATPEGPPEPPRQVTATPTAPDAVAVRWVEPVSAGGPNVGAVTYSVLLNGAPVTNCSRISQTSCTVTGLLPGPQYQITVQAASDQFGADGGSQAVVTAQIATTPTQPLKVRAQQAGLGKVYASWRAPASDGGTAITQYRVTAGDSTCVAAATAGSCKLKGLADSDVVVAVVAVNAAGAGPSATSTTEVETAGISLQDKPKKTVVTGQGVEPGQPITLQRITPDGRLKSVQRTANAQRTVKHAWKHKFPGSRYRAVSNGYRSPWSTP